MDLIFLTYSIIPCDLFFRKHSPCLICRLNASRTLAEINNSALHDSEKKLTALATCKHICMLRCDSLDTLTCCDFLNVVSR